MTTHFVMDLDSMRAFLTVAETGTFSAAAAELHLTQPAVSKRIAHLEKDLGVRLFQRTGHGTRLTQAGSALVPRVRSIFAEVDAATRAIDNLVGGVAGTLSIATNHHIGLWRLPAVLRDFTEHYPDVKLDLHFTDSEIAYGMVAEGRVELGIVTLAPISPPQLGFQRLWTDQLAFVAAHGHPLAQQEVATLENLSHHSAVLPDLRTYTGRLVRAAMDAEGLDLQHVMTTNYHETLKMMAVAGLGWSVLPEIMVDRSLHTIRLPTVHISRDLGLIWHQRYAASNAATAFMRAISDPEL